MTRDPSVAETVAKFRRLGPTGRATVRAFMMISFPFVAAWIFAGTVVRGMGATVCYAILDVRIAIEEYRAFRRATKER